jgi:hypothetical protein
MIFHRQRTCVDNHEITLSAYLRKESYRRSGEIQASLAAGFRPTGVEFMKYFSVEIYGKKLKKCQLQVCKYVLFWRLLCSTKSKSEYFVTV